MEELGPSSAVRSQPQPQDQRERARLQRALQVQEHWEPIGQLMVWEGIKDYLSVLCSFL